MPSSIILKVLCYRIVRAHKVASYYDCVLPLFAVQHAHDIKNSRAGNIILGALVIGLSAVVLAFPLLAAWFLVIMLGISLLFAGIARIMEGVLLIL
jgi:uncharacterized membrane protein HdeD (DUF308 family)